ncbi:MAG: hypothetical protein ACUVTM_03025 [Candidatus Bathyarchaeia archaeon]
MELEPAAKNRRAEPKKVSSFEAFKEWTETAHNESELVRFQKYYGVKKLLKAGLEEVYVDAPVRFLPDDLRRLIDACGVGRNKFVTVLCSARAREDNLLELLELLEQSSNVEAIWIYPLLSTNRETYRKAKLQNRRKVKVEMAILDRLEEFFEGALEVLDLLESSARIRMLFAMWDSPKDKRFFRELVNPKLLYENLEILQRMNLIQEVSSGVYGLSERGENMMREYLYFLDKLRRAVRDLQPSLKF